MARLPRSTSQLADFHEVGVEGGPPADIRQAVVGDGIDAPAPCLVLGPPDAFDDRDPGSRVLRDEGGEAGPPRALPTYTVSPSSIPRARASTGLRKTDGPFWRRRRRSDWLNDEFRKNRFGGTMHWRGKRRASSALSGPSTSGT